jgi:hypothetical protein
MGFCEIEAVENGLIVWFHKAVKHKRVKSPHGMNVEEIVRAAGQVVRSLKDHEDGEGWKPEAIEEKKTGDEDPELEPVYTLQKSGIYVFVSNKGDLEKAVAQAQQESAKADALGLFSGGFKHGVQAGIGLSNFSQYEVR